MSSDFRPGTVCHGNIHTIHDFKDWRAPQRCILTKQVILQNQISGSHGYMQSELRADRKEQVRERDNIWIEIWRMSGSFDADNSGWGNYICQVIEKRHESTGHVLCLRHLQYCLPSKCVGAVGEREMRDSDLDRHASQLLFFVMALRASGGFQAGNGNI